MKLFTPDAAPMLVGAEVGGAPKTNLACFACSSCLLGANALRAVADGCVVVPVACGGAVAVNTGCILEVGLGWA